MIIREKYLNKIREHYNDNFIKILVGMRRVGKSTIMQQIIDEIKITGVKDENIININLEFLDFEHLCDYKELNKYVEERIVNKNKYYLFIDEIQNVKHFEKAINSLNTKHNISIFVTGSNSNLLSSEIATLLSGRYLEFIIYPYSYVEWLEATKLESNHETLESFMLYGGLPQVAEAKKEQSKMTILSNILDSVIYKDIMSRYEIRDSSLLKRLVNYFIKHTSEITTYKNITNYLKSNETKTIKHETITRYVDLIFNSFLIKKCEELNIKGKDLLTSKQKSYLNDVGFITSIFTNSDIERGKLLETIVHNHLLYLGYNVSYGKIGEYEVDFIITKHNGKEKIKKYLQVSYLLIDENTIEREFRPFDLIDDSYEKIIVTQDRVDMSRNGVKHIQLIDLLSNDEF